MSVLPELLADYGPAIGLIGVSATLAINGHREERRHRRDNHARAIAAIVAYCEMPFRIRRRRAETEHRSGERSRLSDAFSDIQAELATCEALIRADRDVEVRDAYEQLVTILRATAGELASEAWNASSIDDDTAMGLPGLFGRLGPVRDKQQQCEAVMASSTRPWNMGTRT